MRTRGHIAGGRGMKVEWVRVKGGDRPKPPDTGEGREKHVLPARCPVVVLRVSSGSTPSSSTPVGEDDMLIRSIGGGFVVCMCVRMCYMTAAGPLRVSMVDPFIDIDTALDDKYVSFLVGWLSVSYGVCPPSIPLRLIPPTPTLLVRQPRNGLGLHLSSVLLRTFGRSFRRPIDDDQEIFGVLCSSPLFLPGSPCCRGQEVHAPPLAAPPMCFFNPSKVSLSPVHVRCRYSTLHFVVRAVLISSSIQPSANLFFSHPSPPHDYTRLGPPTSSPFCAFN